MKHEVTAFNQYLIAWTERLYVFILASVHHVCTWQILLCEVRKLNLFIYSFIHILPINLKLVVSGPCSFQQQVLEKYWKG